MKKKVVILGASAHAAVVADVLVRQGRFDIVGFLDDVAPERRGQVYIDWPILGGSEQLAGLKRSGVEAAIVGFGHSRKRLEAASAAEGAGFELVTAVHPAATVGIGSTVGAGSVIKAGAVVDVDVEIGRNVIIGAGAIVAHGARLEDGVRIAAGAVIGASVVVELGAFVGLHATVRNGARIGRHALVGAASLVLGHVAEETVAFGVPAREVRPVSEQDL